MSEGNLTTTDPCSRYSTSGNATLIANCQVSGVPANYVQLGTTILTTVGGNEDLQPESSTTWTIGTVIQPKGLVPGLSLPPTGSISTSRTRSVAFPARPSSRSATPAPIFRASSATISRAAP